MENEILHMPQPGETNEAQWCFAWVTEEEKDIFKTGEDGNNERAVLIRGSKWDQTAPITISFLDGDKELQKRVAKAALQWTVAGGGPANLDFSFLSNTNDTDIRISFKYSGSWSMVGTTCKNNKDLTKPTMNFGWLNEHTNDDELNRVVLHEFGHAIGLTHEHMHPQGGIPWDKEKVIAELSGPPNNWTRQTIDNNMFRGFTVAETNFSQLDPNSIMMYPIPAKWTGGKFSVGLNTSLSETDKQFVAQQYP